MDNDAAVYDHDACDEVCATDCKVCLAPNEDICTCQCRCDNPGGYTCAACKMGDG